MLRPSRTAAAVTLALAAALALTACSGVRPASPFDYLHPLTDADVAAGGNAGAPEGPPAAAEGELGTPDDGCRPAWPTRLQQDIEDPKEIPYLALIAVCGDPVGGDVVAVNNSDAVWVFGDSNSGRFLRVSGGIEATTFRQLTQTELYPYAFIAPTEVVLLPADLQGVTWIIHPSLSLSWIAHDDLVRIVHASGTAALVEAFTSGSARRNAIGLCTAEVFAASEAEGILQGAGPKQHLLDGLGISSGGGRCADAWKLAEQQAGTAPFPTWAGDVVGLAATPDGAAAMDTSVGWLATAVQDVERVCLLLPGSC